MGRQKLDSTAFERDQNCLQPGGYDAKFHPHASNMLESSFLQHPFATLGGRVTGSLFRADSSGAQFAASWSLGGDGTDQDWSAPL